MCLRSNVSKFRELDCDAIVFDDVRVRDRRHRARFGANVIGDVDVVNSRRKTFRRQRRFDVRVDLFVEVGALQDLLSRPDTGVTVLKLQLLFGFVKVRSYFFKFLYIIN